MTTDNVKTAIFREYDGYRTTFVTKGSFVTDEGNEREYSGGVKISKGNKAVKISVIALAALFQAVRQDEEIKQYLFRQLEEEKVQRVAEMQATLF